LPSSMRVAAHSCSGTTCVDQGVDREDAAALGLSVACALVLTASRKVT
jgi:hypothetical protein